MLLTIFGNKSGPKAKGKVLEMYREGKTFQEIGDYLGVSRQRAYQVVSKLNRKMAGLRMKKSAERNQEIISEAIPLLRSGHLASEVGRMLGVSSSELNRVFRLTGLSKPTHFYPKRYCKNCRKSLTPPKRVWCGKSCDYIWHYRNDPRFREIVRRSALNYWRRKQAALI